MAEPFKNLVNAAAVARIGAHVHGAWRAFPEVDFVSAAAAGLEPFELKARVIRVADALAARLPAPFPRALDVLVAAFPSALPDAEQVSGGFWLWPVLTVVERHGAAFPAESLAALREMTRRFSAEFAIRPILAAHPELGYTTLRRWAGDADVHVRRLVSEGSRPRLPWGQRLVAAVQDPSPGLELLELLVDDPQAYVRRSVANHLGDVAKDHPERAVAVVRRWLGERADRAPLCQHALRDLLKKGHPGALAVFGHSGGSAQVSGLRVEPAEARVGERVAVLAELVLERGGPVRVDVVWQWPSARGAWNSKTFRGGERTLTPGERWSFRGALSLKPVTTRPLRPGVQRVLLRVSGQDFGPVEFFLAGPEATVQL